MESDQIESEKKTDKEDETLTPEYMQKKLYFLLEELKEMHKSLPESYQMRISYELLSVLANTLLNDTIYEIVKGLTEIQHVTERYLLKFREEVDIAYKTEVEEWSAKILDEEELNHIIALTKIKHAKKLKETDMKLIVHLDQKVQDQQSTLERAGVPGFYVTNNPKEVKIQMFLLDFILRLSNIKYDPKRK